MRKRAYRATAIKNVKISDVIERTSDDVVWIGMDVAKQEVVVVVRDSEGHFERPWKVKQPNEIHAFVELILELQRHRPVAVAMEPTGTYGDALRQALGDVGFRVHRVSGKAAKDYSEIFDGVPSTHDGKAAAIIAELAAIGKSSAWPMKKVSDWEGNVERQVHWMDTQQAIYQLWLGRIEGLLSRHWPEATGIIKLTSFSLLKALEHYGGPRGMAEDSAAAKQLVRWSRGYLKPDKIRRLVQSALVTVGVRMSSEHVKTLQQFAKEALRARREVQRARNELKALAEQNEVVQRMSQVVGSATACVVYCTVGDPCRYHCGEAYRKAMGLNLKERSSGRLQGKLKITKRGPSLARRWMFFAALRTIQQPEVAGWYQRKKHKDQDRALIAVIAVMRKLALALHAVAVRGDTFKRERLFPGRNWPGRVTKDRAVMQGALPPDPRDLSLSSQIRKVKKEAAGQVAQPPAPSNMAPGAALGSVPTVALSSDQDSQT